MLGEDMDPSILLGRESGEVSRHAGIGDFPKNSLSVVHLLDAAVVDGEGIDGPGDVDDRALRRLENGERCAPCRGKADMVVHPDPSRLVVDALSRLEVDSTIRSCDTALVPDILAVGEHDEHVSS